MDRIPDEHGMSDDERRIDAFARQAGSAMRRPAPPDGAALAGRSARRHRVVRNTAVVATSALVLLAGVVVLTRGGGDSAPAYTTTGPTTASTVEATVPVATTEAPNTTVAASSTTTSTLPSTSTTTTEPGNGVVAGPIGPADGSGPTVVYTGEVNTSAAGADQMRTIDPRTGRLIGTSTVDFDGSAAAMDRIIAPWTAVNTWGLDADGVFSKLLAAGGRTYSYAVTGSDNPNPDAQQRAMFDACGQASLTVTGGGAVSLPARVLEGTASPDGAWVAMLSGTCSSPGTLGDNGPRAVKDPTVSVYDASHPDRPAVLSAPIERDFEHQSGVWFDRTSRYLAVMTATGWRFFDVAGGREIETPRAGGRQCDAVGWGAGNLFGHSGPWAGSSIAALGPTCDAGGTGFTLLDAASGATRVIPWPVDSSYWVYDVDVEHSDSLDDTWFTLCALEGRCWVGHTGSGLLPLPGSSAQFWPLGFSFGG